MSRFARVVFAAATVAATPALADNIVSVPETVIVTGARTASSTATVLDLNLMETPQSLTVVDQTRIRDFNLTNVNDLLDTVVGVNVERVETDRTVYTARGFDIINFQFDGVGLPLLFDLQTGDIDTAIFDRVEVVRGADGLSAGTGNPSATINYVRKRPTSDFQAYASAEYGSWDARRIEGDVSGPLDDAGDIRGRLVYANEDHNSYLDYYHVNRNVFYGTAAWDITPDLTATVGYSWQDNRSRGVLWGALPLTYSNGAPIDYPVSATTSADWTYWNVREQYAFGELAYHLSGDWTVKGVFTYRQHDEMARLLYAANYPEQGTGLGLTAMSGLYPTNNNQYLFDLYASGSVTLFGREHELVVGANAAQSYLTEYEAFHDGELDYPAVNLWGKEEIALPDYPAPYLSAHVSDRQYRAYAAAHINFSDSLKGVAGFDYIQLLSKGFSYGVDQRRDSNNVSPYAGLVWSLTSNLNAYASYTNIFNPQSDVDINHQRLPAATGNSYEGGVKTQWFGGRLIATAAVFRSEQLGLAQFAGTFDDGKSYSVGVDTFVTGYEFEVGGAISDNWTMNAGWTELKIKGADGQNVSGYVPRQSLKLSTVYTMPEMRDLKLGGSVRWQSSIYTDDLVRVRQSAYAVLDLLAGARVVDGLRATLNVNNVTDEKYLGSLKWNQAFYAEPRSFTVGLNYAY